MSGITTGFVAHRTVSGQFCDDDDDDDSDDSDDNVVDGNGDADDVVDGDYDDEADDDHLCG